MKCKEYCTFYSFGYHDILIDQSDRITFGKLKNIKTNESQNNNFFPIREAVKTYSKLYQFLCFHIKIMLVFFYFGIEKLPTHKNADKI